MAAQCYAAGRVGDSVSYLDASQQVTKSGGFDAVPHEAEASTSVVYSVAGQSERWVDVCRSVITRKAGPHTIARASLVIAFYFLGQGDEAWAASEGLLAAADTTDNPATACFALLAHGMAYHDADPVASYNVLRRALVVARESGNRQLESAAAVTLWGFAATESDPIDAFDYLTEAIHDYHDAGSVSLLHNPLAILAAVFDRLGHHEQAATISGFAATAMTRASYPQINNTIAHLRDALSDQTYESLARKGEAMTTAEIVTYAYAQIDQARTELNDGSK